MTKIDGLNVTMNKTKKYRLNDLELLACALFKSGITANEIMLAVSAGYRFRENPIVKKSIKIQLTDD